MEEMLKNSRKGFLRISFLMVMLAAAFVFLKPVSAQAAKLSPSAKPKFANTSAYMYDKVYLKWGKITGAKKYVIFRAKVNPNTGGIGAWKKWAETTNTSIKKKATGDFKYRVRAVSGSTKSKYSKAIRIFAASAKITDIGFDGSHINFRILINNKTKSEMGFVLNEAARNYVQYTIYALNKKTGDIVKKWGGNLAPVGTGWAMEVNAGKIQSIYITSDTVTAAQYNSVKNCKFLVTASFYPNPYTEPISTALAVACTRTASESAIAGK